MSQSVHLIAKSIPGYTNEALLLLTYLTREAEEIQKIVVFEGAFEKKFSIIKEEGGSEGGVNVQDYLELLNNLLRSNVSNQVLLRETMGFDSIITILKLRGSSYKFSQQKTIDLLAALKTISLLMMGGSDADVGRDSNKLTKKTILVQALHCIGDVVVGHPTNLDTLASKVLSEKPQERATFIFCVEDNPPLPGL